jgi:16S rRNA (adenine(1408)-N(1))-methyltransferase
LTKISEKIHRRPVKGGVANALFVHASAEELPAELDGVAGEVYVHFPWGSLLRAVVTGDQAVVGNLRRICASQALLKIFFSLDGERDCSEIGRLKLPSLSQELLETVLKSRYATAGFEVLQTGILAGHDWPELRTSWAQRLQSNKQRSLIHILARAV